MCANLYIVHIYIPQQELPQSQECPLEAKLAPPGELPRIKKEQYATLEECFMKCKNPNHNDIILAAAQCGMSEEETVVNLVIDFVNRPKMFFK